MRRAYLAATLILLAIPPSSLAQTDRSREIAESHWRRAEAFIREAGIKTTDFEARMGAQHALEAALRYDPDNALYMVELGKIMLKQQVRSDARRVFARAVKAADRSDPMVRAEAYYQLALFYESRWLRFRDRRLLPMDRARFAAERAFYDAPYAWRMLTESVPVDERQIADERGRMEDYFRIALRSNPRHPGAASHLLAFYLDRGDVNSYMNAAQRFADAAPDLPDATLALALGYYRRGMLEHAQRGFNRALAQMNAERARNTRALGRILARERARAYDALGDSARIEFERRYWSLTDPLFSTAENEFWLEYMARVAYADIRYGIPEYDVRGWDTDPGLTFIRYGMPAKKATFAPNASDQGDLESVARITTVWAYAEHGPVFVFRQNAGFQRVNFSEDFDQYASNYRALQPTRLVSDNLPAIRDLPVQLAQFRGANGETVLEVYAAAPANAFADKSDGDYHAGLFMNTHAGGEVLRHERSVPAGSKDVLSWRVIVRDTAPALVAVEQYDSAGHRAAVHRTELRPRNFRGTHLQISDLLLAARIGARNATPLTREDYELHVTPAASFTERDRIGVYFELYGLGFRDGFGDYEAELTITIEELERSGSNIKKALGELADKWGLTREGEDVARVTFKKEARIAAREAVPDYFLVQLPPKPPAGRYALKLLIKDRVTGKSVSSERSFRVRSE